LEIKYCCKHAKNAPKLPDEYQHWCEAEFVFEWRWYRY
jgi:hypothetical protein